VTSVDSDAFSGFSVLGKCTPTSTALLSDIVIDYGIGAKAFEMGLQKGTVYRLYGTLKNSSTTFGLYADGNPSPNY
jgi:hypothetical protein